MLTCPACGRENPDGFQFCGFCGEPVYWATYLPTLHRSAQQAEAAGTAAEAVALYAEAAAAWGRFDYRHEQA